MYIWASAVELGCSREGSFRVSTVPEEAVLVSSQQRWWKGAIGDALQLGTGAAPKTIRALGPGSSAPPPPPQHRSGGCHSCLAGQSHQVSHGKPGVPAALGPSGKHPPSLTVHHHSINRLHCPAPAWSPVLLGGVTLTNKCQHTPGARVLLNTLAYSLLSKKGFPTLATHIP